MKLEDIHNCKECQGKIVAITMDLLGVSRCSYCNQVVDYKPIFKEKLKEFHKKEKEGRK